MNNIKPLSEMTDEQVKRIKLVVFDCDGVIVPKGTELKENSDGTEFIMHTFKPSDKFVNNIIELKRHVRIAFSSGRNLLYLKNLVKDFFDDSVILQAENGAITYINGKLIHPDYPREYFGVIYRIRDSISKNSNVLQLEGFEPKFFILTAHLFKENKMVADIVKKSDPNNIIHFVWGGEAYDFGLKGVTKGSQVRIMADTLGLKEDEIITTGNAMNDKEMLEFGIGVTVEPEVVGGKFKTSGKILGGEELVEFLVEKLKA